MEQASTKKLLFLAFLLMMPLIPLIASSQKTCHASTLHDAITCNCKSSIKTLKEILTQKIGTNNKMLTFGIATKIPYHDPKNPECDYQSDKFSIADLAAMQTARLGEEFKFNERKLSEAIILTQHFYPHKKTSVSYHLKILIDNKKRLAEELAIATEKQNLITNYMQKSPSS